MQFHDELPFAVHAEQIAAHERQEELFGRNRRPADRRVQIAARTSDDRIVDERPDRAQRMLGGDKRLQRQLVEQPALRVALSHHRLAPPTPHHRRRESRMSQKNINRSTLSAAC